MESLDENLHINTRAKLRYFNYLFRKYTKYFVIFVNILPTVPGKPGKVRFFVQLNLS